MLRHVLKVKLEQLKPFVLHLISQNSLKALSALLQESLPRNGPIGAGVTKCSSCFDSIHENLLLSCKDSLKCIVL
ncbi:unnamed protein product [Arabidopsis lyrata]|nr:unnamed protein product [Arabidopsis lyrata]